MNGYYSGPYSQEDLQRLEQEQDNGSGDTVMGMMDGNGMPTPSGGQSLDEIVNQNSEKALRRHSQSMSYADSSDPMGDAMGRMPMMDYDPQSNSAVNFPSINSGLDPAMTGNIQPQMNIRKQNNAASGLGIDTQYQSRMGFADRNFTSPLDMDLTSPYLNSAGPMTLPVDFMNSADMNSMNEFFSGYEFTSPMLASPMAANFGQSMYTSTQDTGSGALDSPDPLADSQQNVPSADLQEPPMF